MFISVHKILTGSSPDDLELYIAVSELRQGKKRLKAVCSDIQFTKQVRLGYWGIPMWYLYATVPGGISDIREIVKAFPPRILRNDTNWGYDFYLNK